MENCWFFLAIFRNVQYNNLMTPVRAYFALRSLLERGLVPVIMRVTRLLSVLAVLILLLSGCMIKTMDELYSLPRRSEDDNNLQSAINQVMAGLEYSAPIQGENQQTVQLADLTGDGTAEAILFAKGSGEMNLKIFVFAKAGGSYTNIARMEFPGTAFEQVEYGDIDDRPGQELVVGRQMGNEVLHALSVYSFATGAQETILTAGYTRFLTTDLNADGAQDVFILRPGVDEASGVAELYYHAGGQMERSTEATMSMPVDKLKRIATGGMCRGTQAVFVASNYDDDTIITDVYTVVDGRFTNVSLSSESGTSVKTMRNYYVYGDDIEGDGLIELPALVEREEDAQGAPQDFIRWYNLTTTGEELDKVFTYHNYTERWYVRLDKAWMDGVQVTRGNVHGGITGYVFSLRGKTLFTIYAFTGDGRTITAQTDGLFILSETNEVTYGASLGSAANAAGVTKEDLIQRFNFIQEDWKTGETS